DRVLVDLPQSARSLAFSPDSATVAVGGADGTIVLDDRESLKRRSRLEGNTLPTLDLAFSSDGAILAALHCRIQRPPMTLEVQAWQLTTGDKQTLPRHAAQALAFVPGSRTLVTQELNGALNFWDPVNGTQLRRFARSQQTSSLYRIVFSPDGSAVV